MMGTAHATSGALAWSALAALGPHLPWHPVTISASELAVGLFACAGAALLPDTDHPDGTIAHTLGWPSHIACRLVAHLAGGHRHKTHTVWFPPLVALATWAAVGFGCYPAAAAILFALLAFGIRALNLARHKSLLAAAAVTAAVVFWHVDLGWLPVAVGLGAAVHIAGDCLTTGGCPVWWPHATMHARDTWTRMPVLGDTGSAREADLTLAMTLATAALVIIPNL